MFEGSQPVSKTAAQVHKSKTRMSQSSLKGNIFNGLHAHGKKTTNNQGITFILSIWYSRK